MSDDVAASAGPPTSGSARYELIAELGRGAMGVAHRARDVVLDEEIVLKVLDPGWARDERAVTLLKNEVKLARRVHHSRVARIHDLTTWEGRLAISMELIDGRPLQDVLGEGPMPLERALPLMRDLCAALQAAHEAGVIHRDLKPANVLIERDGRPCLIDFGVASLSGRRPGEDAVIAGTPRYMAPEQVSNPEAVTPRADLHALGVMLYRMLTGALPYTPRTIAEVLEVRKGPAPPSPSTVVEGLPVAVDEVVEKCLSSDPSDRYGSADELWKALAASAGPRKVEAPPTRLLVIDDDADLRHALVLTLRGPRREVIEAADGLAGLEQAARARFDLILLDMAMPVMGGLDALRILKGQGVTSGVPVLVVTGESRADLELECKSLGAERVIFKPVDLPALRATVDGILAG